MLNYKNDPFSIDAMKNELKRLKKFNEEIDIESLKPDYENKEIDNEIMRIPMTHRKFNIDKNRIKKRIERRKRTSKLKSTSVPIYCEDIDKTFPSIRAASEYFQVSTSSIDRMIKGHKVKGKRYKFRKINELSGG